MEENDKSQPGVAGKTFRYDLWRGGFDGVLDTGTNTFNLFIAIRYFDAGTGAKSLIAAAPWIGMVLSLALVHYASKTGAKKSICGSIPAIATGFFLVLAALSDKLGIFTTLILLAYLFKSAILPFLTSIYNDNYPSDQRGELFSRPLQMTVGVSVCFGFLASHALDLSLDYYVYIYLFLGFCGFGKAFAIFSLPSKNIEKGYENPFGNLKYLFKDRLFGYVLLTWFIMGFANLWIQPLRVDYVTSSQWGIEGSATLVNLIVNIIPHTMLLLFLPFWGRLFDRVNFIVLRICLNILFASGIALFFLTKDPVIIGIGSGLIGVAFSGGSIAWNLWVTKFAPPGKATAYMSVHVFLTGIRGTVGPALGFWTVGKIGPRAIGFISAGMMAIATLMLIPEIKHGKIDKKS
jgi:hypothetical protein